MEKIISIDKQRIGQIVDDTLGFVITHPLLTVQTEMGKEIN